MGYFYGVVESGNVALARYWVPGGSGIWNTTDTNNWSATSGGPSGASVPTALLNVFFDGNSGAGTITKTGSGVCRGLNMTGFTGTFNGTGLIDMNGSLNVSALMTLNHTGQLRCAGSAAKTITLNGKQLKSILNITGAGTVTLQDTFNSTQAIILSAGLFDTNNQLVAASALSKNAAGGATLGSSTLTISGFVNTVAGAGSWNAGTSVIEMNGNAFGTTGAITYNEVHLTNNNFIEINGPINCNVLRMGNTGGYPTFNFDTSFTVNTLMQVLGANSSANRLALSARVGINPITITCLTQMPILSNVDLISIVASGGFTPWTGGSLGDGQGNSGITFTTPVTRYLVMSADADYMSSSTWSASSGGSTGVSPPLLQDTAIIDGSSVSAPGLTLTLQSYRVPSLDFNSATNDPIITGTFPVFFGDFKILPAMQTTCAWHTFRGYGITQQIEVPNTNSTGDLILSTRNSGVLNIATDLYFPSNSLRINSGVMTQSSNNITYGQIQVDVASLSPTWNLTSGDVTISELSGITGTVVTLDPTLTLNYVGPGATFRVENPGVLKTMVFNGKTFNRLSLEVSAPNGIFEFDSGNIFNDLHIDAAASVNFPTVTQIETLDAIGAIGNNIVMDGLGSAPWAIESLSGTTVNADYLTLSNSTASGATFNAVNSIDGGGNTGWNITSFIPSDLANLNIWLDANDPANDGILPADASQITSMIDRSLSGMDFTSPSPLFNACVFYLNQLNGLPGIAFDGLNSWMGSASSINTINYTMFVVSRMNVITPSVFIGNGSVGANGQTIMAVTQPSGASGLLYGGATWVEDGTPDTSNHIFCGTWDGAASTFLIDNVSQSITGDTTAPTTPSGQSWMGTDSTFFTTLNGMIFEVVFYSRALSTAERNQVYAYLKNKWGL